MRFRYYYWPGSGNVEPGTAEHRRLMSDTNKTLSREFEASNYLAACQISMSGSSSDGVEMQVWNNTSWVNAYNFFHKEEITLDQLNEAIEQDQTDGAEDSSSPAKTLFDLDEQEGMTYSTELLETGSVTLKLNGSAYVISLTITKE